MIRAENRLIDTFLLALACFFLRGQGIEMSFPPLVTNSSNFVLDAESFKHYIDEFNVFDTEIYSQFIPNVRSWSFLKNNIPLFECPDKEIEKTYYFRWWTYRKHIKYIGDVIPDKRFPFVVTEFMPNVSWAQLHNTIPCAAGHHLREGRWLHDSSYLDSYTRFWFSAFGAPRAYSFWAADSVLAMGLVTGDEELLKKMLPKLVLFHRMMKKTNYDPAARLYFNTDNRDGMEASIGGMGGVRGYRPTLNSYRYGDAMAIAKMASQFNQEELAQEFQYEAAELKAAIETGLWDPIAKFYKVRTYGKVSQLVDVRELHGYTPWYFNMPAPDRLVAFEQLRNPMGFKAEHGLTTAEMRHPKFIIDYDSGHECLWNGPCWPYATSVTLTAVANVLNYPAAGEQKYISKEDYFDMLSTYARSHRRTLEGGKVTVPWIDENINPFTGDWISRTILKKWENGTWSAKKGGKERGKDYNHSTFVDLIINGLIGLRPRLRDNLLVVSPLVPPGKWKYFCLDRVRYHRRWITIIWDETGQRYYRGQGFRIYVDGVLVAKSDVLKRRRIKMPPAMP